MYESKKMRNLVESIKKVLAESKSSDMFDLIRDKGKKLGDWNMQSFFYYEGNIWMLKNGVAINNGPVNMFRKRMNQSLIKALDPKLKEVESMRESIENEENLTEMGEEIVKGGIANGMTDEDLAKKHGVPLKDIQRQIAMGQKVEMEHTDDKDLATEIARDHVFEDPKYYDKLAKMENE